MLRLTLVSHHIPRGNHQLVLSLALLTCDPESGCLRSIRCLSRQDRTGSCPFVRATHSAVSSLVCLGSRDGGPSLTSKLSGHPCVNALARPSSDSGRGQFATEACPQSSGSACDCQMCHANSTTEYSVYPVCFNSIQRSARHV